MKQRHRLGLAVLSTATLMGTLMGTGGLASAASSSDSTTFSMMFNLGDGHGLDPDLGTWEMYLDDEGIFEGLVIPGPNAATKPRPGMATSWKVSSDGKTYTFTLRQNAKFSNGDPVTAQDFVYGIQRAVNPNTTVGTGAGPAPLSMLPILNALNIRKGVKGYTMSDLGVKALNAHTLQVTLSRKDPTFLRDLTLPTSGWMVPQDQGVVSKMTPNDWNDPSKIVSNGPYKVTSYKLKTSAVLQPNPYYYGKVSFKQINLFASSSATNDTSLTSFRSGQLDESQLQPQDVQAAKSDPSLSKNLKFYHASAQYTLAPVSSLNTALQNPLVRQALNLAIDRNTISNKVLQGTGSPAYSFFLPTWMNPWVTKYAAKYDVTKAKQLLAKAGYPGGKGFPTLHIIVGSTTDLAAAALQQMWEQNLGINVKFDGLEWGAYVNAMKTQLPADQVGLVNVATNATYPDLMLPQNVGDWLYGNSSLVWGYLSPSSYAKYHAIDTNPKLTPAQKQVSEENILFRDLPKWIIDNVKFGVNAFQQNSSSMLQQFYGRQIQMNQDIAIYTQNNPILLDPTVKNYNANQLLLIDPPYWLNDISKS